MNCPNCGRELAENAKFCGGCGTRVAPASETVSAPAPAPAPASGAVPLALNTQPVPAKVPAPAPVSAPAPAPAPAAEPAPAAAPENAPAAPAPAPAAAAPIAAAPAGPDGSLASLWESLAAPVRALRLTGIRKTATIAAAVMELCFLISVDGTLLSWVCAVSGLLLLWLCARGFGAETPAMASAYTLLVLATLVTGVINLVNYGARYFSYGIETVIVHLVFYALVAVIWLCASKAKRNEEHGGLRMTALILSGALAAYELVYCVSVLSKSAKMLFYGLGWLGFIAVYGLLLLKNDTPAAAAPVSAAVPAGPDGVRCPRCGASLPKGSLFCDKCGSSVTGGGEGK